MVTKNEILAVVDPTIIATKDEQKIAEAFSVGRTKFQEKLVGIGSIIETIGIGPGNLFLDTIFANPDFRYVKLLIERGELNVGSSLVQDTIDQLIAASVISAENGNKLKNLGIISDPISAYDVAIAFERG